MRPIRYRKFSHGYCCYPHYPGAVILCCARYFLRFPLAYAHVAELMRERGLAIDASCVWRWVQAYGPELERR